MGRLKNQAEPQIHHFSHPHPLHLSNHQPQQTLSPTSCFGCKHEATGLIYTCEPCNYILHISCSQMPQQITHPFDQNHVLCLLPTPVYPEGLFNCDACGKQGNGFSYHCKACGIDLHILCASMPLHLTHHTHHHQLNLTFSPPYYNKIFSCDICKNVGSSHWLYRCNLCEFDAHLDCAKAEPRAPIRAPIQQHQMQQYQMVPTTETLYQVPPVTQFIRAPSPPLQSLYVPNNYANNAIPGAYGSARPTGSQGNGLLNQVLQGLLDGGTQTLIQGLLGVGGGGGGGGSGSSGDGGGSNGNGGAGGPYDFGGGVGGGDGGSFTVINDSYGGMNGGDFQNYSL